jgi:exodeoxyribonuclease V alpha subunit
MLRLSPLGAARQWLSRNDSPQPPLTRWLEALADRADRSDLADLSPEQLHMAGAMASWQPGLSDDEQTTTALLLLASLQSMGRGSTRLDTSPTARHLRDLIRPLITPPSTADSAASGLLTPESDVEVHLTRLRQMLSEGRLSALIGAPGEGRPLILDGVFLYPHRLFIREQRLALTLAGLQRAAPLSPPTPPAAALADILERAPLLKSGQPMRLSDEQQAAVLKAASVGLCVISGGPGTGKTSIIVSILRLFARLGVAPAQIALAAPTGKAAKRMESAIRSALQQIPPDQSADADAGLLASLPPPSTLHRLLRYIPRLDSFIHDDMNPLPHRVIIVDEASMIDLAMMDQLTRAAAQAQLVLLGDADQLPSVNAGAVLRDLVPATPALQSHAEPALQTHPMREHSVRLEQSFRMDPTDPAGRNILLVARALIASQPDAFLHNDPTKEPHLPRHLQVETLRGEGAEMLIAPEQTPQHNQKLLARFLDRWFSSRFASLENLSNLLSHTYTAQDGAFSPDDLDKIRLLFAHVERARALCLTRGGPQGVIALNLALHQRLARFLHLDERAPWLPGEPAMMLLNDYDRQLFNGDQGLALRVTVEDSLRRRPETGIMLVFPTDNGQFTPFIPDALRGQVEWAHALTVHKSQGSEFDHVAIMLPERDSPLLTRELLYTAATRARRSVVFVGDEHRLRTGTIRHVDRQSGITPRLLSALSSLPLQTPLTSLS